MGKSYRIFFTLFLFLGLNIITAQSSNVTFNVQTPEFMPEKGSSYLFCSVLIETEAADSVHIKISPSDFFRFADSATIISSSNKFPVPVQKSGSDYLIQFGDSFTKTLSNIPFVLVLPFADAENCEINFSIELFENREKIYGISSYEVNDDGEYLNPVIIKTYASNNDTRNLLAVKPSGKFFYFTPVNGINNIKFTFGAKVKSDSAFILSVFAKNGLDTLLSLRINKFGLLSFADTVYKEVISDFFITTNTWNEISLELTPSEITLFANNKPISRKNVFSSLPDTLGMLFRNRSLTDTLFISRITAEIKTEEEKSSELDNLDFAYYNVIDSLVEKANVSASECSIVNGKFLTAIFPPEINISITSAYTTIEWYNDKDENVSKFVLEKSQGFKDFGEIYTIENASKNQRYFYEDYNSENNSVIFYRVKQIDKNGETVYSRQVKVGKTKINDFILEQNYPNPFNPTTSFTVKVIFPGYFHIGVYDLVGKEIQTLHDGTLTQGTYRFNFEANNLPSGIYLLRVKSANKSVVKKMIFAK